MAEHRLEATPTHSLWDNSLQPRLVIAPGDVVHMDCVDSSGGQVKPGMMVSEFLEIDRGLIHALTGPIFVEDAKPGDVLEIQVLEVAHLGWAWTSVIPGLGFLDERFTEPYLFHWELEGNVTRSLAPAVAPLNPFCGVMGVAQAEAGRFRTRPPGPFGGNMDVKELRTGATLYLPVQVPGALFSAGDAHAAQGDGEVCINGMECPVRASFRFQLHKRLKLAGPIVEAPAHAAVVDSSAWMVVESGEDALGAARAATSRMIDLLVNEWGFAPVQAYLLCSVAMDLKLSQVVNRPMTTVSASIAKHVLPARKLFARG
jgi:acetamidase/formamidase